MKVRELAQVLKLMEPDVEVVVLHYAALRSEPIEDFWMSRCNQLVLTECRFSDEFKRELLGLNAPRTEGDPMVVVRRK